MDRKKKPQVDTEQLRGELAQAKERLSGQAEDLSVVEYLKAHPYISVGAAFLSGLVLSGSREAREGLAKLAVDIVGNEILNHGKG